MNGWKQTGIATANKCGHAYGIFTATADDGSKVTRHDAYPDPDNFQYDATDLCPACYDVAMERQTAGMTLQDVTRAFRGR